MTIATFALAALLTVAIPTPQGPISTETGTEPLVSAGWIASVDGNLYVDGGIVSEVASTLDTYSGETPGYQRTEKFGPPWNEMIDGCDTRNRILQRDFVSFTTDRDGDDCTVTTGVFDDPYSGEIIDFQHSNYPNEDDGDSGAVQIDHIIPLKAAWNGGADLWTQDERVAFANNPINLWASEGGLNASKRDRLYEAWKPPAEDFQCVYIAKQVWLLDTYDLAVLDADLNALTAGAAECALPGGAVAAPTTEVPAEPTETPAVTEDAANEKTADEDGKPSYLIIAASALALAGAVWTVIARLRRLRVKSSRNS